MTTTTSRAVCPNRISMIDSIVIHPGVMGAWQVTPEQIAVHLETVMLCETLRRERDQAWRKVRELETALREARALGRCA